MSLADRKYRLPRLASALPAALLLAALAGGPAVFAPHIGAGTTGMARAQPARPAALALAFVDHDGNRDMLARVPPIVLAPRISPDASEIALDILDGANRQARIYTVTVDRLRALADLTDTASLDSLTALPPGGNGQVNFAPAFTPDGQRITFLDSTPDGDSVWWRAANGSGDAEKLLDARSAESWVGRDRLTYLTLAAGGDYGISILDLDSGETETLVDLPGSAQHSSHVSPDLRFLAYASKESGRYEVYVEPLPQTGERRQLTTDGGSHPLWSPDGGSLYADSAGRMLRFPVDPATGWPSADAEALPIEGFVQGEYRRQFDLVPDGSRFLMLFPVED